MGPQHLLLGADDSLPFRTGHSKALTLLGLQPFPGELGKRHAERGGQGRFLQVHLEGPLYF